MAEQKKEEFYALLNEYEALVASLSPEEKVALEVTSDPEDDAKYKNQFFLVKCKTEAEHLQQAQHAVDHCRGMLEALRDELKKYRAKMQQQADGLTPTKLLARYLKLPEFWRLFAAKGLGVKGTRIPEVDAGMRDVFAELAAEEEPDDKLIADVVDKFAKLLKEVEEVSTTVPGQ